MISKTLFALVVTAMLGWPPIAVQADPPAAQLLAGAYVSAGCGDFNTFAQKVVKRGQFPRYIGDLPNGNPVAMFITDSGDEWTLLVVYPNGYACTLAAGTEWRPEVLER